LETEVLIEVSDRGPGIPGEEQEVIFAKFVRGAAAKKSPAPGAGLGLAACRALATAMGGNVGVESVPGQGATFFLSLPLKRVTDNLRA
jgi:signal transduction histidine kinase